MWTKTFLIYGIILVLGAAGWGEIDINNVLRFGLGGALFLIGNVIVWREVFRFGYDQTSGRQGDLIISGFYKYSRNPQYVDDIMLLTGWRQFPLHLMRLCLSVWFVPHWCLRPLLRSRG